jgi:WD40 repeat protein
MFVLLCLAIAACSTNPPPPKLGGDKGEKSPSVDEIGRPLFAEAAWPKYEAETPASAEPIRVPLCHLTVLDKVDVPSKEEGTVAWLGVEVPNSKGTPEKDVYVHRRPEDGKQVETSYRRLRLGDRVTRGQVIALLDETRADLEHNIAVSNIGGAKEEFKAATEAITYYEQNVQIEKDAKSSKAGIIAAQANLARALAEKASKKWRVEQAYGEEKKAQDKLNNHLIRAPISGEVVVFHRLIGEGIKPTEPVIQIQNTDRLGVEGYLEVQFAPQVKVGSEVILEPGLLEPPLKVRSPHASSKPITAVAGAIRNGKQIVISAGEDGSVFIWDRSEVYNSWKHTGAVRALACTRPGIAPPRVLTGCDDGKARIWALEGDSQSPAVTLDGHHEGGVQAAAFAPDGTRCITADDRGGIFLWDAKTGKRIYAFATEHTSAVTALHFTPQCRVVSVGRDNAALIWKVGEKAAAVVSTLDRAGEVGSLGVADDGGQMLLDLDKNRLRVIAVKDQRNLGTFRQSGDAKFSGFALFSPALDKSSDDRLILTSGSSEGILQVWRWSPGHGRCAELEKLVCTDYTTATCAAFSPVAKDGFIIVGTRKGDVHLWPMPADEQITKPFKATITYVDNNWEASGKTVRIVALFDNAAAPLRLRPGMTATLVIPQK